MGGGRPDAGRLAKEHDRALTPVTFPLIRHGSSASGLLLRSPLDRGVGVRILSMRRFDWFHPQLEE